MLNLGALGGLFGGEKVSSQSFKILDTSVIIDGRIADIVETGFLDGTLVIPQFVLRELQLVADSADSMKRNRGRRGLDILQRIQKMTQLNVQILEDDFPNVREVDMKLIELAKVYNCKIVTNDFNLNKVAQLHGVEVLNINELANALKPVVLPGETMRVFILKEGKEYNQGVAYLDDGTMVVVDNAKKMISKTIDISVTSVLQTTAGKMIFGRFDDRMHAVHDKSPEPRRAPARRFARAARAGSWAARGGGSRFRCGGFQLGIVFGWNHESHRHSPGRGAGNTHGASRPREGRHQPQAVHAARRVAHPAPHHPEVRVYARGVGDRGGAAARGYRVGARAAGAPKSSASRCAWWKAATAGSNRWRTRWRRSTPDTELVAVHDAVRPFIELGVLDKVFAEAAETGAAIVGIVPVDTVKQVHRNKIRQTLPREHLVLAQTPQVFRFDLLKRAFAKAREDGFTGTDESSLVERLDQVEVSVVLGSDRNIKITKPSDMDLARLFLAEEMTAKVGS